MDEHAEVQVNEPAAEVSAVPAGMYAVLWISVFMVLTWGMMHLFGTHRRNG